MRAYYNTPNGRMVMDRLLLKLPVMGNLMRKIAVARFCRTLATLLASGVSILEALDITAKTAGNAVVEQALYATRKSIEGGETIAAPLKETTVFPPMVVQMISVGETTGALDTMLGKIADFYEEEVDVAVAGLLTLLEPHHDRRARRRGRRHRHRDVHADLQPDQQADGRVRPVNLAQDGSDDGARRVTLRSRVVAVRGGTRGDLARSSSAPPRWSSWRRPARSRSTRSSS